MVESFLLWPFEKIDNALDDVDKQREQEQDKDGINQNRCKNLHSLSFLWRDLQMHERFDERQYQRHKTRDLP